MPLFFVFSFLWVNLRPLLITATKVNKWQREISKICVEGECGDIISKELVDVTMF